MTVSDNDRIKMPDDLSGYPDYLLWNNGYILFRYVDDDVTQRISADYSDYEEIEQLAGAAEDARLMTKILSLVKDSEQVTQLGSKKSFDNVPDRFEWDCPSCDVGKFQMRGRYSTCYATCISCGERLSVIRTDCSNCDCESVFVKPSIDTDVFYECYSCGQNLD